MDYEFQIINPTLYEGWDDQILSLPGYSFFHTSAWAKVLSKSYGYEPHYLVWFSRDRIIGLIPMMDVKSRLTGRRGVSLPFTDSCEPILDADLAFQEVFERLLDLGRQNRWKYIELRGGQQYFGDAKPSVTYFGHALRLSKDDAKVMSSFRDSTKRNIRKAERSGMTVRILTTPESVREFYRLNCITRRRHGLPPQPYYFFEEVCKSVLEKNLGFVILAYHENKAVAGNIYFHCGDKAVYKYGASDDAYSGLRANNMIMWNAIKWYSRNGFSRLDFGRTEHENEGLRQFKTGWGTREETIAYYRYDLAQKRFVTEGSKYTSLSHRIFSRTPIPLLRIVGSSLYRHVA